MGGKKRAPARAAGEGGSRVYYVVNPGGAIHDCSRDIAAACLLKPGYRMATDEEVAELKRRNGRQVPDSPICQPWTPESEEVSVDGLEPDANDA